MLDEMNRSLFSEIDDLPRCRSLEDHVRTVLSQHGFDADLFFNKLSTFMNEVGLDSNQIFSILEYTVTRSRDEYEQNLKYVKDRITKLANSNRPKVFSEAGGVFSISFGGKTDPVCFFKDKDGEFWVNAGSFRYAGLGFFPLDPNNEEPYLNALSRLLSQYGTHLAEKFILKKVRSDNKHLSEDSQ